jgi:hypothetical protein
MRKIVPILVFIATLSCSKSISQVSTVKKISESAKVNLPYGDKDVLHEFPADWSRGDALQDSLYNKMSFFLFQDKDNPARSTIAINYPEAKTFIAKDFIPSNEIKNGKSKIEIKSAQVFDGKNFKIVSVLYEGKIDCKTCEYPESQTQNVLLSIKDGKVIDKLPVSYLNGSDLGQSARYFYIDSDRIIHLKDFKSDEEGVTFAQYLKYKITPDGKFAKL